MATLTPVSPALAGTALALVAVGASDKFANPKGTAYIQVANANGSSINVTVAPAVSTRPASGQFPAMPVASNVVAVANGVTQIIGPFTLCFNDSNGDVTVTCSATSSVTIAVIQP